MTFLMPVFVVLIVVTILVPPVSLILAVIRRNRHTPGLITLSVKSVALFASMLPLALNLMYLRATWATLLTGQIEPDIALGFALVVSWASIWGRVAVKRMGRQKRHLYH